MYPSVLIRHCVLVGCHFTTYTACLSFVIACSVKFAHGQSELHYSDRHKLLLLQGVALDLGGNQLSGMLPAIWSNQSEVAHYQQPH